MGYRSYRLITVTVTVLEKVTVTVAITVTVSLRDDKVAYASFQAGRRLARKLVYIILCLYLQDERELSPLNHPPRELAFSCLFTGLISFPFWLVPCLNVIILLFGVFNLINFSLDIFILLNKSSSSAPHPQY